MAEWGRYEPFLPPRLRRRPELSRWAWDGLDVRLARRRVDDAPLTCVVLHGGGGNVEVVAPLLVALEDAGYDAVAPDLPGYGATAVPAARFTYTTWVACVRALVAHEHATGRPVAVLGLSMGGMLGYHVAAGTPDVAGVAATNLLDARTRAVRRGVARHPVLGATVPMLRPVADRVPVPIRWLARMDAIANDPGLAEACRTDPHGGGSVVRLGFLRTWMNHAPEVEPEDFDRPVLLAHPGDDRWTPTALSLPFFDRLAGPKRLVILENCGHAPLEEPGVSVLEAELSAFLAGLCA